MRRRTILVFSKIPIAPAFGGNRQRIRTLLAELQQQYDVIFALLPSRQTRDSDAPAHERFFGAGRFIPMQRGRLAELIFNAHILRRRMLGRIVGKRRSANVDYLFDRSLQRGCRALIDAIRPDVVLVEYVHFSKILDWVPHGTYRVLDTHDSFAHEFTPAAERIGLARADAILAIQATEADTFATLLGAGSATRVVTVSHIVADQPTIDTRVCAGAAFIGSYFEANNVSLAALVANVMPLVLAARPDFRLHVIGDVGRAIPDHPFVIKHGRVDVVATALAAAPVLANYIVRGTGIKIKLLDAMAMGVPCVSTVLGADGLSADFAGGVCIAEDDRQFAADLIALYDNAVRRATLARAAVDAAARWNAQQRDALHAVIDDPDLHVDQDSMRAA